MLSIYYSFPMQTTENELVDERWDSDLQPSITNPKNMNNMKDYIAPNSLKEINLPRSSNIIKVTPDKNKNNDDDYFEITTAPPDYPSTPSVTEDDEEDDYLSTPSLNETLPFESNSTYYESLEEEDENHHLVSESICDYHSDLSDYYKQMVLNRFDHISTARLELIESTLPEIYKQRIINLRRLC